MANDDDYPAWLESESELEESELEEDEDDGDEEEDGYASDDSASDDSPPPPAYELPELSKAEAIKLYNEDKAELLTDVPTPIVQRIPAPEELETAVRVIAEELKEFTDHRLASSASANTTFLDKRIDILECRLTAVSTLHGRP